MDVSGKKEFLALICKKKLHIISLSAIFAHNEKYVNPVDGRYFTCYVLLEDSKGKSTGRWRRKTTELEQLAGLLSDVTSENNPALLYLEMVTMVITKTNEEWKNEI